MVRVVAEIEILLDEEDIREAGDDVVQAVQNAIGHTGAQVIDAEVL